MTLFNGDLPHETTVKQNLNDISAGIKIIPAENSMGHLFGHDLFRAIPRLQMAQKSLKNKRRRRRSKHGHRSVFLPFSHIFRF